MDTKSDFYPTGTHEMKIGIDIRELEQGRMTGIGRFLRNFISYVSRRHSQHRLLLYGNQYTDTGFGGESVELRIRTERFTQLWDQVVLPAMANEDGVDIFFSPYIKGPIRVRCPLVVTIHDLIDLIYPEYGGGRLSRALFKNMARRVGRRADLVLVDSDYSSRDTVRLLGLDSSRIEVLPIGLEKRYRPILDPQDLAAGCANYGIDGSYIYYLGNFKPHKNIKALIGAYARLEPGLREHFALVLGGSEDRWWAECKGWAAELGVAERVRFIGQVAEADMPVLYSGAALFAFPSLYEGFGLPPLEAMACGTPVLCSNRASLPEVMGGAGRSFDPQDGPAFTRALAELLCCSEEERAQMMQDGLARAGLFRADVLCERQLQLLEAVVDRRADERRCDIADQ